MSKKVRRIVSWAMAAAILAGGGVFAYLRIGGAGADPLRYRTQPVSRERLVSTVTATGTISPLKTVQVGSQVSGRVLELYADFNSEVKQGDVVARIDPRLFQSDVERAEANLVSARANLTRAEAALEDAKQRNARTQALAAQKLVARAEADAAEAAEKAAAAQRVAAQADVSQAKAGLEQTRVNLALTTIVSPIDGVVISRNVDVGQTVAASLSAPTLFTIAEDMRAMEVHTNVAESDVGALAAEMPVEFTVDAFPGERFRGKVTQIRNAPMTVQNVVTYDAVVRVDNGELKLRPGMTANVTFLVEQREGVLAVPNAALRFTPPDAPAPRGRARTVWVLEQGVPRMIEVKTGITDGRATEIIEGELGEGALVVTGTVGGSTTPTNSTQPRGGAGTNRRRGAGPMGF